MVCDRHLSLLWVLRTCCLNATFMGWFSNTPHCLCRNGYDVTGFDKHGYNKAGFDADGYKK